MISVTYTVSGIEEVDRMLARFRLDALRPDIADLIDEMAGDAASYPPPPSGSKYVRTFNLRSGWLDGQTLFPQASMTQLEAVRENSVSYSPYVQGADEQAAVHQGRWRTVEQLMDTWEERAAQAIEAGIERLMQ